MELPLPPPSGWLSGGNVGSNKTSRYNSKDNTMVYKSKEQTYKCKEPPKLKSKDRKNGFEHVYEWAHMLAVEEHTTEILFFVL